ncbi:MAG: hypothetical protein AAGF72_02030 [Pseudomonadota bacterium]
MLGLKAWRKRESALADQILKSRSVDSQNRIDGSGPFMRQLSRFGTVCLIIGFGMLVENAWLATIPLLFGAALLFASLWVWNKSRKDNDFSDAMATKIVDRTTGLELTTDSRIIAADNGEASRKLTELVETVTSRKAPPDFDTLVSNHPHDVPHDFQSLQYHARIIPLRVDYSVSKFRS